MTSSSFIGSHFASWPPLTCAFAYPLPVKVPGEGVTSGEAPASMQRNRRGYTATQFQTRPTNRRPREPGSLAAHLPEVLHLVGPRFPQADQYGRRLSVISCKWPLRQVGSADSAAAASQPVQASRKVPEWTPHEDLPLGRALVAAVAVRGWRAQRVKPDRWRLDLSAGHPVWAGTGDEAQARRRCPRGPRPGHEQLAVFLDMVGLGGTCGAGVSRWCVAPSGRSRCPGVVRRGSAGPPLRGAPVRGSRLG